MTSVESTVRQQLVDWTNRLPDPQAMAGALIAALDAAANAEADLGCRMCDNTNIMRGQIIRTIAAELGIPIGADDDIIDIPERPSGLLE